MTKQFENVYASLIEDFDSGTSTSSFGDGVTSTATAFSGDNYAKEDSRIPYGIYGGMITRYGMKKRKKGRRRK
jgi:hypothetical protein